MNKYYETLLNEMAEMPVISTHSHHLPGEQVRDMTLNKLLNNTYVRWVTPIPETEDGREAFFGHVRLNSYFTALADGLRALYGMPERLNARNWAQYDQAVRASYADPNWHMKVLRDVCHYERVLLDAYWAPGSDDGHGDLFAPVYRINMYLFGYNAVAADHNGNNPFAAGALSPTTDMDEYVRGMRAQILHMKEKGCVALKGAIPYDRGIDFHDVSKDAARKALKSDAPTPEEIKAFQDYIFFRLCEIAARENLPFQIHTGLGQLRASSPMALLDVITHNPDTKFVLFHGGYPWTDDLCALVHNMPNVYPDLCWLPILSPTACERAVRELLEVGMTDRLYWGCDTWTSEESYGALLYGRQALSRALSEMVARGQASMDDARATLRAIMHDNAASLYRL